MMAGPAPDHPPVFAGGGFGGVVGSVAFGFGESDRGASFLTAKNLTRLSSLLGTWTGIAEVRGPGGPSDVAAGADPDVGAHGGGSARDGGGRRRSEGGGEGVKAYVAVHLTAEPTRQHGCEAEGCEEASGRVCVVDFDGGGDGGSDGGMGGVGGDGDGDGGGEERRRCADMSDGVVGWSDVAAFVYFGLEVDSVIPPPSGVRARRDSGSWSGPYGMILARDVGGIPADDGGSGGEVVVDRYVTRYVETPSSSYLRPDPGATIYEHGGGEGHDGPRWGEYVGVEAVRETVRHQSRSRGRDGDDDDDPYAPHLADCAHGPARPRLPLLEFEFVRDAETGEETLDVRVRYRMLYAPGRDELSYGAMPHLRRRFGGGTDGRGFRISGPYCYGDDPNRAWSLDLDYDSSMSNPHLKFRHGCVRDLPCTPPGAAISASSSSAAPIPFDPPPPDRDDRFAARSSGAILLLLSVAVAVLSALLVTAAASNRRLTRGRARLRRLYFGSDDDDDDEEEYDDGGDGAASDYLELEVSDDGSGRGGTPPPSTRGAGEGRGAGFFPGRGRYLEWWRGLSGGGGGGAVGGAGAAGAAAPRDDGGGESAGPRTGGGKAADSCSI